MPDILILIILGVTKVISGVGTLIKLKWKSSSKFTFTFWFYKK